MYTVGPIFRPFGALCFLMNNSGTGGGVENLPPGTQKFSVKGFASQRSHGWLPSTSRVLFNLCFSKTNMTSYIKHRQTFQFEEQPHFHRINKTVYLSLDGYAALWSLSERKSWYKGPPHQSENLFSINDSQRVSALVKPTPTASFHHKMSQAASGSAKLGRWTFSLWLARLLVKGLRQWFYCVKAWQGDLM